MKIIFTKFGDTIENGKVQTLNSSYSYVKIGNQH